MPATAAADGLHRKLVWLTLFRVVTVTVLLGGTVMVGREEEAAVAAGLAPLYAIVIGSYAATIVFGIALRLRRFLVATAYAQVLVDVAVAAALVALTGRSESVFVFMFSLAIVNGAILLFRRGAAAALGLSLVAYALVAAGADARASTAFAHAGAFVATAVLASYLAEQLRSTGERLAASETDLAVITALHESIVQSLTSGLVTLDGRGRITFLNPAAEAMTGLTLSRARGVRVADVLPDYHPGSRRDEIAVTNARGESLRLGYSSFPLLGREGEALGSAIIFQDLTRLRAMEDAVQRAERLADLGRLAAGLAHELRNPLAAISGSVELLRARKASADDARLMDIVLREASRLDGLVEEFLTFARPPPVRLEEVALDAVLGEVLAVFANGPEAAGLSCEARLAPASARCDPGQVRQVAWNLLRNAAEALAERGGAGRIVLSCGVEDGGAVFAVEDDGPGIATADVARIFDPFFTTREQGTGLGLATVHRIVDAHGGRITVDSEPARGARFTVHLPAPAAAAAAAPG